MVKCDLKFIKRFINNLDVSYGDLLTVGTKYLCDKKFSQYNIRQFNCLYGKHFNFKLSAHKIISDSLTKVVQGKVIKIAKICYLNYYI